MTSVQSGIINEEWRTINGYINFQVSNLGNVRDTRTGRFKPITKFGEGYLAVYLREGNTSKQFPLHRLVAMTFIPNPDGMRCVDHINHNKHDNTVLNLRWASTAQNGGNRNKQTPTSSSVFKGISWHKRIMKWQAQIRIDGNLIYLGCFDDEEAAARAYDRAAREAFGEFALLNF